MEVRVLTAVRAAKLARLALVAVAAWLVASCIAFVSVVGFELSLMPEYFRLGWSGSGLELASFVWLIAWPIWAVGLFACWLVAHAASARPSSSTSK